MAGIATPAVFASASGYSPQASCGVVLVYLCPTNLASFRLSDTARPQAARQDTGGSGESDPWPEVDFRRLHHSLLWDFTHGLFATENIMPVWIGVGAAGIGANVGHELSDKPDEMDIEALRDPLAHKGETGVGYLRPPQRGA